MAVRALYLHIPFCCSKCAYCDFDSRAVGRRPPSGALDGYVSGLVAQLGALGARGALSGVRTAYIGGGTPTLLGARLLGLIEAVRAHCDPVEFTCEANPESLTPALARGMRDAGVTRISLGVQSLADGELRSIGRVHSAARALEAVRLSKSTGLVTSCDLMCGLPGQTQESWARTLEALLDADPDHVSVYPLQLEEGTPLAAREAAGEVDLPDEDFQARCMDAASRELSARGYARYEVASHAKPGARCEHNIAYWTGVPYLGLGRSAASMCEAGCDLPPAVAARAPARGRVRFRQLDDAGERFDVESLTDREAAAEDLMLACRMTDGIPAGLLARARGLMPPDELDAACRIAVEKGLARWDAGSLRPTHLGWLEGNELFGIFWGLAR